MLTLRTNKGWNCDGRKHFKKCFSLKDLGKIPLDTKGWTCRPCDFDLCIKCIQISILYERTYKLYILLFGLFKVLPFDTNKLSLNTLRFITVGNGIKKKLI